MQLKLLTTLWCVLFSIFSLILKGQELPPISVYTPQHYSAGDQNWAISQGDNNALYFANNSGLLQYNGAKWTLYPSPNETIIRSVKVINAKIYTGSYMDFGFWEPNSFGTLTYTSLINKVKEELIEDEEFWEILHLEDWILFQSFDRIYIYNITTETFKIISTNTRITKIYKVNELIYYQKINDGIYKIENGEEILVTNSTLITNEEVVNIFQSNEHLLIQTKEKGFYKLINSNLIPWDIESSALLSNISVYSSTQLKNGSFILGTISNGIIQLSSKGKILLRIDQFKGLNNNTVLSVFEDATDNIWLGLDNGINTINLNSPYKIFKDNQGVLGTIYTALKTDKHLYLGTNQGLFYKKINTTDSFKPITNTKGQVWELINIDGTIFCGHDKGTFIIDEDKATSVSNIKGAWCIKKIPGQANLLLQGNYKGLNVLEKTNNTWALRNKIKGFDVSSRHMEFINTTELLVSHEYKGVFRLKLDSNYFKVITSTKEAVPKGINSSITSYKDTILYVYEAGVFSYNDSKSTFEKDSLLSSLLSQKNYTSGKLINDRKGNKLWGFSKNQILFIEPGKLSNEPTINKISLTSKTRKTKSGYENIICLEDGEFLFGNKEGYIIVDTNLLKEHPYSIQLNAASYNSLHKKMVPLDISTSPSLKSNYNNIKFNYSVAEYNKFSSVLFQYRLEGLYNDWSSWSSEPEILFENLPSGDYIFEAKAKVGELLSNNTILYHFTIKKPWYLKPLAIITYVICLIVLLFFILKLNKNYYIKQRQKEIEKKEKEIEFKALENKQQLMQLNNKNLQQDVENKGRELGISTMNLIKKNELLNSIKKELTNAKQIDDFKVVVDLINKNLNTTDDWKLFEEAFNNADKNFLKTMKTKHPSLTPNDLRLCTYLRLNLSSKEIAPLLNISPRSVEVKRYRLRKKMALPHEYSLTNYILEI